MSNRALPVEARWVVTICAALCAAPLLGDDAPRKAVSAEQALVYLIQDDGSRRHLFARQEWLGVLDRDGYLAARLDPGEQFIWADDARSFASVYLMPGATSYLRVGEGEIDVLEPRQGEALLERAPTRSIPREEDRSKSYAKLKRYRKARARAARAGLFEPCRFADARLADYRGRIRDGDPQASHILGNVYWYGECVERDVPEAIGWYQDAARRGHVGSMVTLGNIYYRGTNVPQDPAASAVWYRMAAENGDLFSQRRLAEMHQRGLGVEQDTDEAIRWYRKAARDGNDQWALVQLESIDPAVQERRRLEAEAEARAKEKERQRLREQRQRIHNRRLARIGAKYDQIAVTTRPPQREAKLQPPRRKKPEEDGNGGWDGNVAYMLPPEIALGVVALGMVVNAVEKSLDSRLSAEERERVEAAASKLAQLLEEQSFSEGLERHLIEAGRRPGKAPLFLPAPDEQRPAAAADGTAAVDTSPFMILEVETTGIGLMLADRRYRQSHFVMSNHVKVRRREDGIVLKDRALCYASADTPNFSAWAADEGERLLQELKAAYAHTAQTVLLILADEAYGTSARSNALCDALLTTVEARRTALLEPDR